MRLNKLFAILILAVAAVEYEDIYQNAYAFSLGDIITDVKENTHITAFEGVNGLFYHSVNKGAWEGGGGNSLLTYRFLTGDISWTTTVDQKNKGSILGGPSLHVDRLLAFLFPDEAEVIRIAIPPRMRGFYDGLFYGLSCGWDLDRGGATYGYHYGYRHKF